MDFEAVLATLLLVRVTYLSRDFAIFPVVVPVRLDFVVAHPFHFLEY
jgi:hypothetical protein